MPDDPKERPAESSRSVSDVPTYLLSDYLIERNAVDACQIYSEFDDINQMGKHSPSEVVDMMIKHIANDTLFYFFNGKTEWKSIRRIICLNNACYFGIDVMSNALELISSEHERSNHLHNALHKVAYLESFRRRACTDPQEDYWKFMPQLLDNDEELLVAIGDFIDSSKQDSKDNYYDSLRVESVNEFEDAVINLGQTRRNYMNISINNSREDLLIGVAELIRISAYFGHLQNPPAEDSDLRSHIIEYVDVISRALTDMTYNISGNTPTPENITMNDILEEHILDEDIINLDINKFYDTDDSTDYDEE